jgi:hypothetical protein
LKLQILFLLEFGTHEINARHEEDQVKEFDHVVQEVLYRWQSLQGSLKDFGHCNSII